MAIITVYGIPNCNSVKKTKQYLDQNGINYNFINFKKDIPSTTQIENWLNNVGIEQLVNKKSTTWRQLDDNSKQMIEQNSQADVCSILQKNVTLIKRPVIEWLDGSVTVGYDETLFENLIN
ncbi:MAG: Spx/MgsR family RNA polymerase-binding regulatory protein [Neisseriaceae bacterium]|nr:Spx/MgsR family RNA polymerase-binding regulatory protein [Neisseriaceae bacterium PsAf]MCV2503411.1 Spx/MgsR family RNA polymerase-binding regulatory protein [Neisseriaceae bacterium]MCV2509053.1 Spx/MgsR family RNA polymerase-binding regulatory protein [Neisseriaceae bacterium]